MDFGLRFVTGQLNRRTIPVEVAEMALGHTVSSKVEAAYRRGDLYEKRKGIMADWARYCSGSAR